MQENEIVIPHKWRPRWYQRPMWSALSQGGLRAYLLWHRRSGKDDNSLHFMASRAITRPATYWYMLPKQSQIRKAIWSAVNPHTGIRRIHEAFPDAICRAKRDNEMVIELVNDSMIHFVGSDNFDSLVGSPPLGLVFSEYALTSPLAWPTLAPILLENGGWCIINTTPRGHNHAYDMWMHAKAEGWYTSLVRADESGVFTEGDLARTKTEYVRLHGPSDGESLFMREFMCSFEVSVVGSYYGSYLTSATHEGRITRCPHDTSRQVITAWDLGVSDSTAIWFVQQVGAEVRVIDYIEGHSEGLEHYTDILRSKPYQYAYHILPHDMQVREFSTGKTRLDTLRTLGFTDLRVLTALPVADGISAVRSLLPRCVFDEQSTRTGVEALRAYCRAYDETKKVFSDRPEHSWASHGADAFRYLAIGLRDISLVKKQSRPGVGTFAATRAV